MADDNVIDLEQRQISDAFQLIENHPIPLGTMLMSEETLNSFEEAFPGFRDHAEKVVDQGWEYWKVQLDK